MNDERSKLSLPTWIPEGLLIAQKLRASAADGAIAVLEKSPDSEVRRSDSIDLEKLERIRNSIRVSPQVSAEAVLSRVGFSTENAKKSAFFWKTVLDVWGGFSWLAPLVSRYGARVTVADPVFFDANPVACFEKDLETIRKQVRDLQDKIAAGEGESKRIREAMAKNLAALEKVYTEMFFWKGYDQRRFPSISRLAAFAENLSGLPDASQDFVFATNVICKPTVDVEAFHSELLRVLSPDGHAYFLDYDDPSTNAWSAKLESLLRKTRPTHSFSDGWFRIVIS